MRGKMFSDVTKGDALCVCWFASLQPNAN